MNRRTFIISWLTVATVLVPVVIVVFVFRTHPTVRAPVAAAKVAHTESSLNAIRQCLEALKNDLGRYPTSEEGLAVLLSAPAEHGERWAGPYLAPDSGARVDAWGEPFHYRYPGQYNKDTYDLWSKGPNRTDDSDTEGSDDIRNWRCEAKP